MDKWWRHSHNPCVAGSSPAGPTIQPRHSFMADRFKSRTLIKSDEKLRQGGVGERFLHVFGVTAKRWSLVQTQYRPPSLRFRNSDKGGC